MQPRVLAQELPRLPKSSTCASARWQAVVTRDATANSFVYAVLTTRIYCRPSCPARLARRANVRFYDNPSQAERAGFRPCKRCKPDASGTNYNPQVQSVHRACQTIKAIVQSGSKPTLQRLAAEANLTPSHLLRVFKKVMGVTPGRYVADMLRKDAVAGNSLEGSGIQPEPTSIAECNPCDGEGNGSVGLDGGGNSKSEDGDGAVLWNEFDVLIAAEAGFVAMQDVQPVDELLAWHGVPDSYDVGLDETSSLSDGKTT
ncbi:putative DNA repair and transcription factor Ada [Aspergillus ibericus CBS 121593]|uniref:HTH araC/xylS-type domain-containing protein n=1 Tax=Aspergillus ibericus CBS 121593 TaxID=1448316 RepID=A0A395HDM4_9EURO|nr:hypothetical protein BO80DRAFT_420778 [Aspergillus ibericus CBS 121593]RAL05573.1 hypothetical protein BO80DRAFT_420778 [Aspergillus ibericus CBS 121593]